MVWPALLGMLGGLFGGGGAALGAGAAGTATAGAAAGTAGSSGALGSLLSGGSGVGASSALEGIMGQAAGPQSMMGSAGPQSVASAVPAGTTGMQATAGGLGNTADPTRWDKFLSSVEGDMEKPMSQGQRGQLQQHMQGGGIMDASRPQYGMEDFRSMFSGTEQGERERIINTGLMSPYVEQLLGGKYV